MMLARCCTLSRWRPMTAARLVSSSSPSKTSAASPKDKDCQLLIIGAGSGGLSAAAILGGRFNTVVVDSADNHYYQPYFTLVGAGLKRLEDCRQPMKDVCFCFC